LYRQCGGAAGAGSDKDLLRRFAADHDDQAFADLVRRHGGLVYGVCRRLLAPEDAEDAFQATFLLLALKAATIRDHHALASWLHGAALRTSLSARKRAARRRKHERSAAARPVAPAAECSLSHADLREALDAEIRRLPEPYRAAFLRCGLQGQSRPEAAAALGCTAETLSSRLARARQILQRRLARRGLAPAVALGVADVALGMVVPPALATTTVQVACLVAAGRRPAGALSAAVAALLKGELRTMLLTKVKTVLVVLAAAGVLLLGQARFAGGAPRARSPVITGVRQAEAAPGDQERLAGLWQAVALEANGQPAPAEAVRAFRIRIQGDRIVFNPDGENREHRFTLDPKAQPKAMDLIPGDGPQKGQRLPCAIYRLEGDKLTLCLDKEGEAGKRPTAFKTAAGDGFALLTLERVKKAP
jgi:RNA polymerase sigma factor (sigma-70 family)